MLVPRNKASEVLMSVIFVLVSLNFRSIDSRKTLTLCSTALASSRVPLIPIIQSSAYLTYDNFLKLGSWRSTAGKFLASLDSSNTKPKSPFFFALEILL